MTEQKSPSLGLKNRILDLFFPPRCVYCGRILPAQRSGVGVCFHCADALPRTKQGRRRYLDGSLAPCMSALKYEAQVRQSILRYKFQGRFWYARVYGEELGRVIDELDGFHPDLITWAPLSQLRLWRRGYDQAELLAREAAKRCGMQPSRLLRKRRNTRAQSTLSGKRRKENTKAVYETLPGADVEGKTVLLVDDIVTTGSTLDACALELLRSGAAQVVCLTLADA